MRPLAHGGPTFPGHRFLRSLCLPLFWALVLFCLLPVPPLQAQDEGSKEGGVKDDPTALREWMRKHFGDPKVLAIAGNLRPRLPQVQKGATS